ncbi:hypothetical protein [Microseira wollei]|uniref:Transposase n=1 Tax=Microseira wollei NIES-4236 TaxID=2530354 RepID=A0AAV3XAN8_9CYAN|nr:hypothetical protein [Microseira wollei]GET39228.1 hypothetical protein MiSe_39920 [Microseira wollei NIES-4236]
MIRCAPSPQGINSKADSRSPLKRTEEVETAVGFNRLRLLARKLISGRDENFARVFLWLIRCAPSPQGINSKADSRSPLKQTEKVDAAVGFNRLRLLARKLISGRVDNFARFPGGMKTSPEFSFGIDKRSLGTIKVLEAENEFITR